MSQPADAGGLGFGFKWNMGWMHDTLEYMAHDPVHRRWHHDKLTFGLLYAFTENFVLPLSHDEVVHGKGSILGRMPGDDWQRFANLRAYYGFMWGHPGKKLLFMGQEFGQRQEWNFAAAARLASAGRSRCHQGVQRCVRDLNRLYRDRAGAACRRLRARAASAGSSSTTPSSRCSPGCGLAAPSDPPVVVVCNFTPVPRDDYRVGLPRAGRWRRDAQHRRPQYGGSGVGNLGRVTATAAPSHGFPASSR